ncbi:glycoside hydrolase family 16 protein [Gymnopus androsaceus JB14]|uniref:Glycoside hydrolase family 16 protein n=1 Tax=Gymnopus androsaceus JB14 TaxID=1447944 RepID=A0A6A4HTP9_9AGAR|nr:glycoside hydrolase family 16 protein [Gymnopus androsaceus JB14]
MNRFPVVRQVTTSLLASDSSPEKSPAHAYHMQGKFAPRPGLYSNSSHSSLYGAPTPSPRSSSIISAGSEMGFDPQSWDAKLIANQPEADDELHTPNPKIRLSRGNIFTCRGLANIGCILILSLCIFGLFVGYPIANFITRTTVKSFGVNATGQVPKLPGNWGPIDLETPDDAKTFSSYMDGSEWKLVFSDEFNTDGRTFYPGDDPYWEAGMLVLFFLTGNLNWYDPAAIITKNGSLEITLSKTPSHGLDYMGGMLATWNKFCFTGGLIQASVSLPGKSNVSGLWPAIWTLGNLGRVGYGATLEGMWPYSYDTCDVGTVANQTLNGQPAAANKQPPDGKTAISNLPGQRLSRCTCPGEEHPGPKHSDGSFVGRSAPEIDMFEAQVDGTTGAVSQSAQWAPFNNAYEFQNTSVGVSINNTNITMQNSYTGGPLQQATSYVTETNQICYQQNDGCFSTYAVEYQPGYAADNAYITWVSDGNKAWTLNAAGVGADSITNISARPITSEPMYLIANLGISSSFAILDLTDLVFPAVMRVDWIRVYQPADAQNVGCDPDAYPTLDYINANLPAYQNPNLTTWRPSISGYNQPFPKNSLVDTC